MYPLYGHMQPKLSSAKKTRKRLNGLHENSVRDLVQQKVRLYWFS